MNSDYLYFLEDLTDGVFPDLSYHSTSLNAIISHPKIKSALAFHGAWFATFGFFPSKPDVAWFINCVGDESTAITKTLFDRTQIRVLSFGKQIVETMIVLYKRTLSEMTRDSALRLMTLKLADRFGRDPIEFYKTNKITDGNNAISIYKKLIETDPILPVLESWVFGSNNNENDSDSDSYYERCDKLRASSKLNERCIFSNNIVTVKDVVQPLARNSLSAIELVRRPILLDLMLWRTQMDGVLWNVENKSMSSPKTLLRTKTRLLTCGRDVIPEKVLSSLCYSSSSSISMGGGGKQMSVLVPYGVLFYRNKFETEETVKLGTNNNKTIIKCIPCSEDDNSGYNVTISDRQWWIPSLSYSFSTHMVTQLGVMASMMSSSEVRPEIRDRQLGTCHFHQFVTTYAARNSILAPQKTFETFKQGKNDDLLGTVVVCDTRENWWTLLCLLITLDNLDVSRWHVAFFCNRSNRLWADKEVLGRIPNASIVQWDDKLPSDFDIDVYNALMTSREFWTRPEIVGEYVITIQDDGAVIRKGLETDPELLKYDYVGAPWVDAGNNASFLISAGIDGKELVGNGGISLRRRAAMVEVIETDNKQKEGRGRDALFFENVVHIPEDVYFASRVERCAPRAVAERWSFEECLPSDPAARPYAFHKPWCYLPPSKLVDQGIRNLFTSC